MLIKDIVEETARLLGLTKDKNEDGEESLYEGDEEKLLAALGSVIEELGRDYFPLADEEILSVNDGKIEYSAFSRSPTGIVAVKKDDKCLPFVRLYDGIKVEETGQVSVRYLFRPARPTMEGETEWKGAGAPMNILAYGCATEYCIMCGRESDAVMWDKRYRDSLERAMFLQTSGKRIKARRWL